jgi:hypothetical protein
MRHQLSILESSICSPCPEKPEATTSVLGFQTHVDRENRKVERLKD